MTSGERRTAERLEQKRDDDKSFNGDDEAAELPSSMRLVDLPLEQLARRCARRVGRLGTRLIPGLGRLAANCFVPRKQALCMAYRTSIHPDAVRARCLFDPPQGRRDGHRIVQISSGQYPVGLIDEGGKPFSFKSVGNQTQGRTTILKINYRNTRQILQTASLVAVDLLVTAHREGHVWADMAILCSHHSEMDLCAEFLRKRKLPHQLRRNSSSVFDPAHDSIKVMTLHVSKGLEFPVVALVGAGRMPAEGEDEREEARLFYVGAKRATQRLVIGASVTGRFAALL